MGNQMFQYALGRMLSIKNKTSLGLDLSLLLDRTPRLSQSKFTFRDYDLSVFNIDAEIVSGKSIPFIHRWYFSGKLMLYFDSFRRKFLKIIGYGGYERFFRFDSKVLSLGPDTYLDGDWQSPKYFNDIKDTLIKDFTLKKELSVFTQNLLLEISSTNSVCVHVRRGDFVGSSFHPVMSLDYYIQALSTLSKMVPVEKIYVFSDDIAWCRENLVFPITTTFVGDEYRGKKAQGHFMLMQACHHFIIANSSFSWWTAWLGSAPDKVVIAPNKWFGDPSIDTSDLIPENWIRI